MNSNKNLVNNSYNVDNTIDINAISSGVKYLLGGYFEYANEIIINRALPSIYDGLKPVNRRILYTLYSTKTKTFRKCARASGDVLALHPHSDDAVYAAMVLLTDKNGTLAFPYLEGQGYFGGVAITDPPAAKRYTEVKLSKNSEEFFGEMNGINMMPNFDSTLEEPELLPVSFPNILVNSTSGIAIGFRSNIPSFNFNEVCDLVKEYIEKGECTTMIAPDFVTGGFYVEDKKELRKLMETGKARLKLRGRASINDKEINVTEVPYGKTIQNLIKQINDSDSPAIRNAYDTDDFEHGAGFTVDCTSKTRAEEALYSIYKNTDFQYTYSADITVIKDNRPTQLGVWSVIESWVNWRREVIVKEYKVRAEACKERMREAKAFMTLVNDKEKSDTLVTLIKQKGKNAGKEYVRQNFSRDDIPEDLIDFVTTRGINLYHDGGKYASAYESNLEELNILNENIANPDKVILKQMDYLKATYGVNLQRRTEVTDVDYQFEDTVDEKTSKIVDTSPCIYSVKNGFIRKLRMASNDSSVDFEFNGNMNDTLIAFDNRGRLIRIYCEDIPINGVSDIGTYIPNYCGFSETDDYRITYVGKLTGDTLMLIYKDGNIGFVDTSEWTGNNRRVKVLERGIAVSVADKLGAVLTDIPEILLVSDTAYNLGLVYTKTLKRKDRTAKTRAFNLNKGNLLDSYACMDTASLMVKLANFNIYANKLKPIVENSYSDDFGAYFIPM